MKGGGPPGEGGENGGRGWEGGGGGAAGGTGVEHVTLQSVSSVGQSTVEVMPIRLANPDL
eukprot:scaffold25160_cov50-Phaeocystis_antarctica.AAC.2